METQTIEGLRITDIEDGSVICERGWVQTNGESADIRDYDPDTGRWVQKARLSGAKLTQRTGAKFAQLTGTNEHMIFSMGIPRESAIVTYKLEFGKAKPLDRPEERV